MTNDQLDYECDILEHINIDYDPHLALQNAISDLEYAIDCEHVFPKKSVNKLKLALANAQAALEESQ